MNFLSKFFCQVLRNIAIAVAILPFDQPRHSIGKNTNECDQTIQGSSFIILLDHQLLFMLTTHSLLQW